MHLVLSLLWAGAIVSSWALDSPVFGRRGDGIIDSNYGYSLQLNKKEENAARRIMAEEEGEDADEDVDFHGDEFEDENSEGLLGAGSVDSLMHIHHQKGEILVPCFGMWWPMGGYYGGGGGGGGGYEYIDYYGDYRKKKRRSRKQKKAARMKKKKSS